MSTETDILDSIEVEDIINVITKKSHIYHYTSFQHPLIEYPINTNYVNLTK